MYVGTAPSTDPHSIPLADHVLGLLLKQWSRNRGCRGCSCMPNNFNVGAVHPYTMLLKIYLKILVTTASSEHNFSALKRIKRYLRNSTTQSRLNHCMLLHVHKD